MLYDDDSFYRYDKAELIRLIELWHDVELADHLVEGLINFIEIVQQRQMIDRRRFGKYTFLEKVMRQYMRDLDLLFGSKVKTMTAQQYLINEVRQPVRMQ